MIAIIAKYDIDHILKMTLRCIDFGKLQLLSAVKISFPYQSFMVKDFDFFALK